jgi:hypothetical protein
MREAEGIIAGISASFRLRAPISLIPSLLDHVDFFSYVKGIMTNSAEKNILCLLQDFDGSTYKEAKVVVENKIRQKEDFSSLRGWLCLMT